MASVGIESLSIRLSLSKSGLSAELIDANEFYKAVAGLSEEERKAFRHIFYTVLSGAAKSFGASITSGAIVPRTRNLTAGGVKTQHKVLTQIGLDPRVYGFEVVEPLRELFKPQVRGVARYLGLPKEISERMLFPRVANQSSGRGYTGESGDRRARYTDCRGGDERVKRVPSVCRTASRQGNRVKRREESVLIYKS